MKKVLLLILAFTAGTAAAQIQSQPGAPAKPGVKTDTTIEAPLPVEPPVLPKDMWAKKDTGIIGQFINAPNVLQPINPLAKPELGFGEQNINRDPITGRIKGLNLLVFNF